MTGQSAPVFSIDCKEEKIIMNARKVSESGKSGRKFVRYREGAERYSLGETKFRELAKEAGAIYKVDKIALVNCEIFEAYLETFREW